MQDRLTERIRGSVRFDALSRTIYSTDASIYEIVPAGVVLPLQVDDVVSAVHTCRETEVPLIARGAGTGLTGGAVGAGLILDLSRHMMRIGPVDHERRMVEVEPGVVLDELNAQLAPSGLQFAPDVATASRATIGGMIANNSCGAHSVHYGRTVDHVAALTVVLSDGAIVQFGIDGADPPTDDRGTILERELAGIRDRHFDEIQRRFPKIMRSNGGYGLDRLGPPGRPAKAVPILCGSEGTLGVIVSAKLRLISIPRHRGLVLLSFGDLFAALSATPAILRHAPAAIELIDRMIIEAARRNPAMTGRFGFLKGHPEALLVVEFFADQPQALAHSMQALAADRESVGGTTDVQTLVEIGSQNAVWDLRKAGLGLLMSKPGDAQPYAFVEDTAVDPSRLSEYIRRFHGILRDEKVEAGYYAHASVGCLHVKPILNLKSGADVDRMQRIAQAVGDLAIEFGGTVTGEHGDGIVRSCWLERMYGPRILAAFREVKHLFDPDGLFNPHKIVDPWPMTAHLRYGPSFHAQSVRTSLDFSLHGGPAGLAAMCTGVGQCRQRLVGTMCPSFIATGDELHTTRARANALRTALSNRGLLKGLDDPHLAEVMDLCLGCKACKTECPTGVDMARLKSEWLSHRNLAEGAKPRARTLADFPHWLTHLSRWPRLANGLMQSRPARAWADTRYGLDRRVAPPRLATCTFRRWYRRYLRRNKSARAPLGNVIYFVDTWTNYFVPEVGMAAVKLLNRAGFHVLCPHLACCERPAISQGLLTQAKDSAEANIRLLTQIATDAVAIVGTEPSCILTLVDEYPQLVPTAEARRIASLAVMLETFLQRVLALDSSSLPFLRPSKPLRYHAHCHQKAMVGSDDAVNLLKRAWGEAGSEIPSGCCGMAGSFGHETEHYDIARAIGEDRLFPAVRNRGAANVAVSGFSCRTQIQHHTGVRARHLVEYLSEALDDSGPRNR